MISWNIWVIRQNKFDSIKFFLENDVPEVKEIFFPTVSCERKIGEKLVKKRVPLYSGYLFLRYDDNNEDIFYKVKSNPFITGYVGKCSKSSVEEMKEKEEWNVLRKEVGIGDKVEVTSGPLKKCNGVVNAINGNNITINVTLFDRVIPYTVKSDDVEIVSK